MSLSDKDVQNCGALSNKNDISSLSKEESRAPWFLLSNLTLDGTFNDVAPISLTDNLNIICSQPARLRRAKDEDVIFGLSGLSVSLQDSAL